MIPQDLTKKGGHVSLIQYEIDKTPKEYRKNGGMQVGNIHLKPILLYLPDQQSWVDKWRLAQKHLSEQGFEGVYNLAGVHAAEWGIQGNHIYLIDDKPEEKHYVGDGNVGNYLSQYSAYLVMDALDYSHYWYLESDARMVDGWKEKIEQALLDSGDDWDILFVGSCCCNKEMGVHVKGDVYEFGSRGWNNFPLCTHSYIINKRCIPHMIATNRDVLNNTDISMMYNSFPKMRVLAILPILSYQHGNDIFKEFQK
jgi:hypothetical protein